MICLLNSKFVNSVIWMDSKKKESGRRTGCGTIAIPVCDALSVGAPPPTWDRPDPGPSQTIAAEGMCSVGSPDGRVAREHGTTL